MLALYISALPDPRDENKFNEFYLENKQILLKVAYDHIHDKYLSEDCVHEVLLYIAEHFDRIDDIHSASAKGYALTITRAYANRFFKESIKEDFIEDLNEELEDEVNYTDVAHNELDLSLIAECIESMKEPHREVFILRIYHDLPFNEIAEITGLSENYVRKLVERCRNKLMKDLKKRQSEITGDKINF